MSCAGIRLEDRVLDLLEAAEAAAVDRHVEGCAACRIARRELEGLVDRLNELPSAVPDGRARNRRKLEGLLMVSAASLLLCALAWLMTRAPQDPVTPAPAKQEAPHAKEIDRLVDGLSAADAESREKAEKAIVALAKDLEHALAALDRAKASADPELSGRADRTRKALVEALGKLAPATSVPEDLAKEIELLTAKIRHRPDADLFLQRAQLRIRAGDPQGAITDVESALRLDPARAGAWSVRAEARAQLGRLDDAAADFARAVELNPKLPEVWLGRGRLMLKQSKFAEAIADLDRAIELNPQSPEAFDTRGRAREGAGDLAGALDDFNKAKLLRKR
jgi:tetratricopeptide (TPR) repeat protein